MNGNISDIKHHVWKFFVDATYDCSREVFYYVSIFFLQLSICGVLILCFMIALSQFNNK